MRMGMKMEMMMRMVMMMKKMMTTLPVIEMIMMMLTMMKMVMVMMMMKFVAITPAGPSVTFARKLAARNASMCISTKQPAGDMSHVQCLWILSQANPCSKVEFANQPNVLR